MPKRFTDINPQTSKDKAAGSEPSLMFIIEHYYTSHGIALKTAQKLAGEYVAQWTKQESSNVDVTGASGAFAAKRPCGQKG